MLAICFVFWIIDPGEFVLEALAFEFGIEFGDNVKAVVVMTKLDK